MIAYDDKRKLVPEDKYLFSVTQINEFFANPNEFFRKVILKEDIPFACNATVLGTLCHYAISQAHENKEILKEEINEYRHSLAEFDNLDWDYILNKFNEMKETIIYNATNMFVTQPTEVEQHHILKLTDNVYIGGTLDARYGNLIVDYKTTSDKYITEEKPLPSNYINQLYAYSYILHQEKIAVDRIAICYMTVPDTMRVSQATGKRMKDYPCKFIKVEQYLSEKIMKDVENKMYLIAETIEYILKNKASLKYFARDLEIKC